MVVVNPMKIQPMKVVPIVINKNVRQSSMSSAGFGLVQPQQQIQKQEPMSTDFVIQGGPLGARPLDKAAKTSPRTKYLKDASKLKKCTPKQLEHYEKNWEKIVSPTVVRSLRRHREDVLHGGRSLNMLLPTQRPTKDWDIYSPREKTRAQALEREIDRKTGCDVCQVKQVHMPKTTMGPDSPETSKRLYRIVTEHTADDADVDVMDKPKGLRTTRAKGITHESLEAAREKAAKRMRLQPMYMWKAMLDKQRIEQYWRMKGKEF